MRSLRQRWYSFLINLSLRSFSVRFEFGFSSLLVNQTSLITFVGGFVYQASLITFVGVFSVLCAYSTFFNIFHFYQFVDSASTQFVIVYSQLKTVLCYYCKNILKCRSYGASYTPSFFVWFCFVFTRKSNQSLVPKSFFREMYENTHTHAHTHTHTHTHTL